MHIHTYREREERCMCNTCAVVPRQRAGKGKGGQMEEESAVGFHNFNLRIFNSRVSNPNKLIVDVFVDTMSDFNVPGSRPKKTR